MDTEGLVPDILQELPSSHIIVTYPNGKQVNLGEELTPFEVKEQPCVKWECAADKYYTLLMFDPDAPSRRYPVVGEVKHWLVGNIKDCDLGTADVLAEYRGAGPPRYTGLHRYFFLVFEQDGRIMFEERTVTKSSSMARLKFSTKNFMDKYRLDDKAVAWNCFTSQWGENLGEGGQETRGCVCM